MRLSMVRLWSLNLIIGAGALVACAPEFQPGTTNASSLMAANSGSISIYTQTLYPLLTSNCGSCHGVSQVPMFAVSDPTQSHATVITSGLVDLANPGNSRLVTKIAGGHQSFATSLATQLQTQIAAWATQLQAGGGPLPPPPVLEATFQSISALILVPKCVGCHGPTLAESNVRYDTHARTLTTVNKLQPAQSKLYTECLSGSMPDNAPNLSQNELDILLAWITAGAQDN